MSRLPLLPIAAIIKAILPWFLLLLLLLLMLPPDPLPCGDCSRLC
jgi:hypothetical protein